MQAMASGFEVARLVDAAEYHASEDRSLVIGVGGQADEIGNHVELRTLRLAGDLVLGRPRRAVCADRQPGAPGSVVDVTLTGADGTDTLAGGFTYDDPPAPTLLAVSTCPLAMRGLARDVPRRYVDS